MSGEVHMELGGLPVVLLGDGAERAASLDGMGPFLASPTAGPRLVVELEGGVEVPDCRWLHRFDMAEGSLDCRFGRDAEGVYYHTFGRLGALRFDSRRPDRIRCSPIGRGDVLKYALWTAFALMGLHRGALPVHASAVVCQGRAVLCLGESGTGKSTHTALWLRHVDGCHLLNDDSPILRLAGGEVAACGSPWSGKTACYRQERRPVAALLRLEQAPHNRLRRLGTVEALTALLPSLPPVLARDEQCLDRLLQFADGLLRCLPVYRLQCLPDADAALLAHHTLFPQ